MTTSNLMSSTAMTQDLQELLDETAAPDIAVEMQDLSTLIQAISKELVADDPKKIDGAAAGDFALPRNGERILVKGQIGYPFIILDAWIGWPEYLPNRGGFVAPHDAKPRNAVWFNKGKSSDGKAGLYLVDIDDNPGNRIEETYYVRVLVLPDDGSAPFVVTQAYKSTAKSIGNDMLKRVTRKVNGKDTNPVLSKLRMTSRLERSGDDRWYAPNPILLGRFGEPNGPTEEQVRLGAQLRKAFKDGAAWEAPLEPPAAHLASMSGHEQRRTPIVITSGRPALRSVETAPPLEPYDGPDDRRDGGPDYEEIPF
jgi:hypothetical protein